MKILIVEFDAKLADVLRENFPPAGDVVTERSVEVEEDGFDSV